MFSPNFLKIRSLFVDMVVELKSYIMFVRKTFANVNF